VKGAGVGPRRNRGGGQSRRRHGRNYLAWM
jgi:hypothetical protein